MIVEEKPASPRPEPSTTPTGPEIFILGGFRIVAGGAPVEERAWKGRKAQLLVKLLAVRPGHRLHREQIADALWPHLDPESAENQIHKALHQARRALEPDLEAGGASRYLVTQDRMVSLSPDAGVRVDADAFEAAARAALESADAATCEAASALYGGELLPGDLYEPWSEPRRAELRMLAEQVRIRLGELLVEEGRHPRAIEVLRELVAADATNERAHRALMLAHARSGDRHLALQQYAECVETLDRELGVEPSPETVRLRAAILAGAATGSEVRPETEADREPDAGTPAALSPASPRTRGLAVAVAVVAILVAVVATGVLTSTRLRHKIARISERGIFGADAASRQPVSISGRVDAPGARLQALDSLSGWSALADAEGRFTLADLEWRPGGACTLLVSASAGPPKLLTLTLGGEYPAGGTVDVGDLALASGAAVEESELYGMDAASEIPFDARNGEFYRGTFVALTIGKAGDVERLAAVNAFVASRYGRESSPQAPRTARETIERGSLYSGPLPLAMATIVHAGGYPVRLIDVADSAATSQAHTVVEVYYDGNWHLYDPAYGVAVQNAYGRVVGYADLRRDASLPVEAAYRDVSRPGWDTARIPGLFRTGIHHYTYFKAAN